jgi:hypothetical protein
MKKAIFITASIAVVGLIGGSVVLRQQLHLSTEFHAQLLQFQKSAKAEQDEQDRQMDESIARQRLENARMEESNDEMRVQIAENEGKGLAGAQKNLSLARSKASALELSQTLLSDSSQYLQNHEPSSAVVYAGLPSHANTYRDHLVINRFKSLEASNTEFSACMDKNPKPGDNNMPKVCKGFLDQAFKDRYYIAAAIDNKY